MSNLTTLEPTRWTALAEFRRDPSLRDALRRLLDRVARERAQLDADECPACRTFGAVDQYFATFDTRDSTGRHAGSYFAAGFRACPRCQSRAYLDRPGVREHRARLYRERYAKAKATARV